MDFMYVLPQRSFLSYNMGFDIAYIRNGCAHQNWHIITEITELFFSNLSNPEGGSEIRDFSGSFLWSILWITEISELFFQ